MSPQQVRALVLTVVAVFVGLVVWGLWRLLALVSQTKLPNFDAAYMKAWTFVLLCLSVAAFTMAFVQICRTLVPVRGYFHKAALHAWLKRAADPGANESADQALLEFERRNEPPGARPAWTSALFVPSIYDLPIEQLCGQLTLSSEAAIDRPHAYRYLLRGLIGESGEQNLHDLLTLSGEDSGPEEALKEAEARTALTRLIQLRIDGFQISAGGSWRRILRFSVVVIAVGFSLASTSGSSSPGYLVYAAGAGLAAAYLAMLLRDLAAIVELKRRQA